jgi:nucleoside-diphosphate-sugar epimerase
MSRHVVFGTGQVGGHLLHRLTEQGHDVTGVNRSGRGSFDGARIVAGDATDPAFTRHVTAGADVVYFCLNASSYAAWSDEFPPLQRAVLEGAAAAGARLVVLDNLYAYGPSRGRDLVETRKAAPSSSKGAVRSAMTDDLLAAHESGRVSVAIGRASDYFGPGTTNSALGEGVFGPALTGKTAQVMGRPKELHSYSYTPDVAAALATLGAHPEAAGAIWHLPVVQTVSTREMIERTYALAGHSPRIFAAGRVGLSVFGVVNPTVREYLHTLYQFTDRWVVDDSRFRSTFGVEATPLDAALTATLTWFRQRAEAATRSEPAT